MARNALLHNSRLNCYNLISPLANQMASARTWRMSFYFISCIIRHREACTDILEFPVLPSLLGHYEPSDFLYFIFTKHQRVYQEEIISIFHLVYWMLRMKILLRATFRTWERSGEGGGRCSCSLSICMNDLHHSYHPSPQHRSSDLVKHISW